MAESSSSKVQHCTEHWFVRQGSSAKPSHISSRMRGKVSLLFPSLPDRHLATSKDPTHVLEVKTLKLLSSRYEQRH